jgi:hypothetical protein
MSRLFDSCHFAGTFCAALIAIVAIKEAAAVSRALQQLADK